MSFDRLTEAQYAEYMRKHARPTTSSQLPVEPPPARAPKYRNRKTADGFDSEKEGEHWQLLQAQARVGQIAELRRQVRFALIVQGIHICDYIADFVWKEGAQLVVADTKSAMTRKLPAYRIKFKLMQACLGIQIREL